MRGIRSEDRLPSKLCHRKAPIAVKSLAGVLLAAVAAFAAPTLPDATFTPAPNVTVGTNPRCVASGDFNGDNFPDMAVVGQGGNNVEVLLGKGDGSFGLGKAFSVGSQPVAVVSADFDQDGKLDLAVVNSGSNSVSILLGNGDGTFGPARNFSAGSSPTAIVVGDFNWDGKPDLAIADFGSNSVSVLVNQGNGNFAAPASIPVGLGPRAIAAADLNRDGKLDIVTANDAGNNVSVLLGNGDGTFSAATNFPAGTSQFGVAIGDLNGDGNPDLVVANGRLSSVAILLGDGYGGFGAPTILSVGAYPRSVVIGDFNLDGKADLAVANSGSNSVTILEGNGDGTFPTARDLTVGKAPVSIVASDWNSDTNPDLAVANQNSDTISVLLNSTEPPNTPPTSDAGADQTIECAGPAGAQVTLTGSGSDPDNDPLNFTWKDENGTVVGTTEITSVTVPLGTHAFTLTVDDGRGLTASATTEVTVNGAAPPTLSVQLSPNVLTRQVHGWVPITADIQVTDSCDPNPSVTLVSITSNDLDGPKHDIRGATFGTDDRYFLLRAEHQRRHDLVYSVVYSATDKYGNSASAGAQVTVLSKKRKDYHSKDHHKGREKQHDNDRD